MVLHDGLVVDYQEEEVMRCPALIELGDPQSVCYLREALEMKRMRRAESGRLRTLAITTRMKGRLWR